MRINQVEKSLKHCLKRKVSLNEAVIVGFLIMGMGAFATDIVIGEEDTTYIKSATLASNSNTASESAGNGINSVDTSLGNITNQGIVSGKISGNSTASGRLVPENMGNGIAVYRKSAIGISVGNIENNGLISGEAELTATSGTGLGLYGAGNGISLYDRVGTSGTENSIGNIGNKGIIKGKADLQISTTTNGEFRSAGNGISLFIQGGTSGGSIGNITNEGLISGEAGTSEESMKIVNVAELRTVGNGISVVNQRDTNLKTLGNVVNSGKIKGEVNLENTTGTGNFRMIGNGISDFGGTGTVKSAIGNIGNTGIISGKAKISGATGELRSVGNGIVVLNSGSSTIDDITNSGVITGKYDGATNNVHGSNSFGNGIYSKTSINSVKNTGLIAGSHHAIHTDSVTNEITNYGVLAGAKITNTSSTNGTDPVNLNKTNHGIEILLNADGTVKSVEIAESGATVDGRTVINAGKVGTNDSYMTAGTDYTDKIINGVGTDKGVLNITSGTTILNNSVVNAYQTAVSLQGNATLNATNATFNGGGLDGKTAVIKTEGDNNKVSVTGNSVINGDISVNGNTNIVTIGNNVAFNGNNIGASGEGNTLNLGDKVASSGIEAPTLDIYGNITGFDTLNIKGNVAFFETAKLENVKDLDISADSNLLVKIDASESEKKEDKTYYSGHALHNSGAEITGEGTLIFGIAGVEDNGRIALGDAQIDSNMKMETNILGREIEVKEGDLVVIRNIDRLIDPTTNVVAMKKVLNAVYDTGSWDTILLPTVEVGPTSGKTSKEATEALNVLLDSMITGNLATVSQMASKASMDLFNDVAINNPFTPSKGQWLVDGGAIYNDASSDFKFMETASVNGDLGVDYSSFNGYGKLEYGFTDRTSVGTVFGGGKSKIENDFGSDLDGNSAYLGLYAKHKTNFWNWDLHAGAGYQYTDYEGTRISGNQYQTLRNDQDFSVKGYTLYAGARKTVELGRGFMWEPKAKITYTSLQQDEINETGDLAMNVSSRDVSYLETEFGANLRRDFNFATGVGRARAGVAWNILLEDHLADTMEANFVAGGDNFELLVPKTDRSRAKFDVAYEFEKSTGWSYTLGATYGRGKKTDDLTVRAGAGYKF